MGIAWSVPSTRNIFVVAAGLVENSKLSGSETSDVQSLNTVCKSLAPPGMVNPSGKDARALQPLNTLTISFT